MITASEARDIANSNVAKRVTEELATCEKAILEATKQGKFGCKVEVEKMHGDTRQALKDAGFRLATSITDLFIFSDDIMWIESLDFKIEIKPCNPI
jgi:hypothetical protein